MQCEVEEWVIALLSFVLIVCVFVNGHLVAVLFPPESNQLKLVLAVCSKIDGHQEFRTHSIPFARWCMSGVPLRGLNFIHVFSLVSGLNLIVRA